MGGHRRNLAPPPLYDEVSVERRQTKRGSQLITKRSNVSFHHSHAGDASPATSRSNTALPQAPDVPGPVELQDYNEIAFEPDVGPVRKGKVWPVLGAAAEIPY